ncbi:MAG: DUF4402 domain-containing protein [Bacteroidetes bacterium]|nr:DUF4402 domain-containing protein [Bacteroidota bacterium]
MSKNLRGPGLTALLALFVLDSYTCVAQTTATATAAVYAVVVRGISVTASNGLDFGRLTQGSGVHKLPSTAPDVGSFTISGQPGTGVSLTFSSAVTLRSPQGGSLAFKPEIPIWNFENSQLINEQVFPAVTGGRASFSSKGLIYVWFGGAINTDSAVVGSYSGQYTVTITY